MATITVSVQLRVCVNTPANEVAAATVMIMPSQLYHGKAFLPFIQIHSEKTQSMHDRSSKGKDSDINIKLKAVAAFIWLGVHSESWPD